jgi:hypothetical protein
MMFNAPVWKKSFQPPPREMREVVPAGFWMSRASFEYGEIVIGSKRGRLAPTKNHRLTAA